MTDLYKYPRTPHLPWSGFKTEDDRVLSSVDHFVGKMVVVTEKMDGECTSMYRNHYHARSLDTKHHPSRTWIKAEHGRIRHDIPEGFRVCGENVYAKHSLAYDRLTSYFYVFGIYDADNFCLPWAETVEYAALLGLEVVPVIYQGVWDEKVIRDLHPRPSAFGVEAEGYVVRTAGGFAYADFAMHVAKSVRENHVTTSSHWMQEAVVPNKLK